MFPKSTLFAHTKKGQNIEDEYNRFLTEIMKRMPGMSKNRTKLEKANTKLRVANRHAAAERCDDMRIKILETDKSILQKQIATERDKYRELQRTVSWAIAIMAVATIITWVIALHVSGHIQIPFIP